MPKPDGMSPHDAPDLTLLPQFPQFTDLGDEHKGLLQAAFRDAQPEASELTFAYLWAWLPYTGCRVCHVEGTPLLMVRSAATGEGYLLPPVTREPERAVGVIVSLLAMGDSLPVDSFARVPDTQADLLFALPGIAVMDEPERADYVYLGDDLRELTGRLRRKRRLVQQFWSACPDAECRDIDDELAEACAQFCRNWLSDHPDGDQQGLRREVETTVRLLQRRKELALTGVGLLSGGEVVAFALGEALNDETFVERVEKADIAVPGAYQAINQEFARRTAAGYELINREQDLGIPGLRRAKQSYCPDHLVRKYRVKLG